jgi:hypothetical protein
MRQQAQALADVVSVFRTGASAGAAPAVMAKPKAVLATAAVRTAKPGSQMHKPAAAKAVEADWEEF